MLKRTCDTCDAELSTDAEGALRHPVAPFRVTIDQNLDSIYGGGSPWILDYCSRECMVQGLAHLTEFFALPTPVVTVTRIEG
jgi:hypothetical protein